MRNLCFVTDAPLGKLCTWLRIMGYRCFYSRILKENTIEWVVESLDIEEKRAELWLLTRQKKLYARAKAQGRKCLFIEHNQWENQLIQVIRSLSLPDDSPLFSRCLRCDELLREVEREEVEERVPPYVYSTHRRFKECPKCGRIYWPGSHASRMQDQLRCIFDRLKSH